MDNCQIVEDIVKQHLLENIIKKVTNNSPDEDLYDLRQDIYVSLLQDKKLQIAYRNNQLGFYLARIVMNNIASSTSPYYRIYKKPRILNDGLIPSVFNIPDD